MGPAPRMLRSFLTGVEPEAPPPQRPTPPLLDELRAVQELLDGDAGPADRASSDAFAAGVRHLALTAAWERHRQQTEDHAFELGRRRRQERQAEVRGWLGIALAVVVIAAAAVGGIDPLVLLPR